MQKTTPNPKEEILEWLIVAGCVAALTGFVCSRALASIGMAVIVVASILGYGLGTFKQYFRHKELLVISLFLWIVVVSGIYSHDKALWLNWVRIKVPYLVLPLAFAPLKRLDEKKFTILIYGFMLVCLLSALVVLVNYYRHYDEITNSLYKGSAIPMPYSHIRYTLLLAFSFFCAVYLWQKNYFLAGKSEKWFQLFYAAFIFVVLHILVVRSGLVALYLGLLYLALYQVFSSKRYLQGGFLIVLMAAAIFLSYRFLPGINNKIAYMRYDLSRYAEGEVNDNSDAMRLLSMQVGLDIWKEHKWLGVGSGDLRAATDTVYARQYPAITPANRRIPHNQFIWVLAGTGIIGLAIFLIAFFYPFIANGNYRHWIFMVLYLILFSSFFTEDTLEEQIGTGFYLIFLLVLMNHFKRE